VAPNPAQPLQHYEIVHGEHSPLWVEQKRQIMDVAGYVIDVRLMLPRAPHVLESRPNAGRKIAAGPDCYTTVFRHCAAYVLIQPLDAKHVRTRLAHEMSDENVHACELMLAA
jgi:hypothetical protein